MKQTITEFTETVTFIELFYCRQLGPASQPATGKLSVKPGLEFDYTTKLGQY